MDMNEKRPKRPRITASHPESNREYEIDGYQKVKFGADNYRQRNDYDRGDQRASRPYQPRFNSQSQGGQGYQPRTGGYQPRDNWRSNDGGYRSNQGGYNAQGAENGYRQRQSGYQPRYNGHRNDGLQRGSFDNGQQGGFRSRVNDRGDGFGRGNSFNRNRGPRQFQGANQQRGGKTFTPRPRPVIYDMPIPDPNEQIRLNKFMSNAGICSRREADEYIKQGLVKVNGQVVTELGTKISHSDNVEFDEKLLALENKVYVLLNKPKDCVTTSDDPQGRTTVLDLVKGACSQRIYPVGRLDRNTTGVLLLTNDGDLASKLTHPQYVKKKIYHVWCDRDIAEADMQRIADGIELEDGEIHADAISYATPTDRNQAGIEIHSGRNRIVRRIFEKLGYHVTKLDRVYFAGLTKKNLPRGRWRYLTQQEVNQLKQGSFE